MTTTARSRASLTLLDQGAYSLGSLVLVVACARSVGQSEFGRFGLALTLYYLIQGLARCIANDPWTLNPAAREGLTPATPVTSSVLVGLVGGLAIATSGALLTDSRSFWVTVGCCLPVLLAQDAARLVFIGMGHPRRALTSDICVLVALLVSMTSLQSAQQLFLWWSGGAVIGVGTCGGVGFSAVRLRSLLGYWIRNRRLTGASVGEFATANTAPQLTIYALAAYSPIAAVGALRAAQSLFGPANVLAYGAQLAFQPELVATARTDPRRGLKLATRVSWVLALIALVGSVVLRLLPATLGRALLGDTWPQARELVFPVGISIAASGAGTGALLLLRARQRIATIFRIRVLFLVPAATAGAVGAAIGGVSVAAWTLAAAAGAFAVVAWRVAGAQP